MPKSTKSTKSTKSKNSTRKSVVFNKSDALIVASTMRNAASGRQPPKERTHHQINTENHYAHTLAKKLAKQIGEEKKRVAVIALEQQQQQQKAELLKHATDIVGSIATRITAIVQQRKPCLTRQTSGPKSQGNDSTCIQHSVGRVITNANFPNLSLSQKEEILRIVIEYLTVPEPMIFDGSLIPEFLHILQSTLGNSLQIVEGDYALGNLPNKPSIMALFNQYARECIQTADNSVRSSPLWTGNQNCYEFKSYFVCYVLIPETFNEDNMYTLGRLGYMANGNQTTDAELIKAQSDIGEVIEKKPIKYNDNTGLYSVFRKIGKTPKYVNTPGHALVIKGCSADSSGTITHFLVRNSWDFWDNPALGGSWVPYKFFPNYTYGIIRIVNQPNNMAGKLTKKRKINKRKQTRRRL
jgi:hypothetical protein